MSYWWYITHAAWGTVNVICGNVKQVAGDIFNGCGRVF